ncbi:MAG: hypothetical protein ACI35R_02835 [Bacillus sp. (in: firmicutes)]
MSVEIRGEAAILAELERRFGQARIQRVSDEALREGAKVFVKELKSQLLPAKKKGDTIKEITVSEPFTIAGMRMIRVYWKGPRNRYRIIHLNEYGTVKNPNPKAKGAIARAVRNSERAYRNVIEETLRRGFQ